MEEAARVIARLERIEELRRGGGHGGGPESKLMAELRALVPEAEAWARAEGDGRART
ncbi:MAG: hypothetical protein QOH95_202, partial [Gaiellaceae bacterium]|nr:hypothetical protein [Gaiellaceae bacterium]